jgi:hypothetical protein
MRRRTGRQDLGDQLGPEFVALVGDVTQPGPGQSRQVGMPSVRCAGGSCSGAGQLIRCPVTITVVSAIGADPAVIASSDQRM